MLLHDDLLDELIY